MHISSLLYCVLAKYREGFNREVEVMPIMPEVCHSQPKQMTRQNSTTGTRSTSTPMEQISHFNGTDYLLVIDYILRFFVTHQLKSQTSKNDAQQMKSILYEYTPPQTLITDIGPCYTSMELKEFIKDYIKHIMSSSHYHKGTGLAEKYIDIVKNWPQKAKDAKQDLYKLMLI